jgi:hypothetical protein
MCEVLICVQNVKSSCTDKRESRASSNFLRNHDILFTFSGKEAPKLVDLLDRKNYFQSLVTIEIVTC